MNARGIVTLTALATVLLLLAGGVGLVLAQEHNLGTTVGTAFTYQGQLTDDGDPAEGDYDFEFKLHDHPINDSQVGSTIYVGDNEVTDGLFTVLLDFGSGVFNGEARYLEIGVRPGDGTGAYTTLAPRQELTAAPYAHYALDSGSTHSLQGHPVSDTAPTTGQLLQWAGSAWVPATAASANQPPVAVLQADPTVLMPWETTTFSLSLSYDPEGGPLTYAFDPTGQTLGPPSSYGSTGTTTVTPADYETAGDYLAAGWVKDGSGAFDVARTLVSVYKFWNTAVDSNLDVGAWSSMAVVDGRPAIAYQDTSNGELKYVRALYSTGSCWGAPHTLDAAGGPVGWEPSLATVDEHPAVAYHDNTNDNLRYVRANDATGSSWGTPLTVDSDGDVGQWASLTVVENRPAIAYYDNTNHELKYVRANDATGSSWGTPLTVDSAADVGESACLAVVDGCPAIAYFDQTYDDLKYVRANDATGSSWGTPLTVDTSGAVGWQPSLVVVDGRPAISYAASYPNWHLKYVRASDTTGSSWPTPITVDSAGDVGLWDSLAVVAGRPAISYYDESNDELKYVRADDITGSSWGTPLIVDSTLPGGWPTALAVLDDRPAICYYDGAKHDLRFAIPRHE